MIKPGTRWKSGVCDAEIIVVRPSKVAGNPQCGGVDMVASGEEGAKREMLAGHDGGCLVGKRYKSESAGIEVLCTKQGRGSLGFAGVILTVVESKKLPASD